MNLDRRRLFAALAGIASVSAATPALARKSRDRDTDSAPAKEANSMQIRDVAPRTWIDGASLGLRPNAAEDQAKAFQHAIEYAAAARAVLHLTPGFYRAGGLRLPPYAAIAGIPGASRIVMSAGPSILMATGSDHVSISGLVLDGSDIPVAQRRGLIHLSQGRAARITDCEIVNAGSNGITLEAIEGEVTGNTVSAADNAIFSVDARGLRIAGNTVRGAGNGGILVWRSTPGDDGTLVVDNRIEGITNKAGGSGEYGNGINVFRANNVIVRGNRIHNAAFSAVRGNSASNLQIVGNTCTKLGETALYSEFAFEGALIANNIVDGATNGIAVTNFNQGGRLAVVQGNLIRNIVHGRGAGTDPNDTSGVGIGIEADTVVSGNVVENVPRIGIAAGWGPYLRDVTVSANVVRGADYGIAVSVVPGAGAAVIADNLISEARLGAIVGMEWKKLISSDLSKEGATRYAQLSIGGNRIR
jgi:uncharacterized secreted repeat protein (TIGR03808 family)